ncbi:hypothetical protein QTO34_019313 [Cnephaeus nilssonii]|uniref:Uncharacterized protein n=1 Tax=Cnephaeus nilssonii TaxID=3371016 RepID=A0AA40HWB5_CNENI|nr:hypothetical protein QTO34_019313 [Eptesicus nilssonii]
MAPSDRDRRWALAAGVSRASTGSGCKWWLWRRQWVKWFLEMASTLRKDAGKIVGLTTKDLEHYLYLAEKEVEAQGAGLGVAGVADWARGTLSSHRQRWLELSVCAMAVLQHRRGLWGSELMSHRGPSKAGELGACPLTHQAFQKPPPRWRLLKSLVHQWTGTQLPRDRKRKREQTPSQERTPSSLRSIAGSPLMPKAGKASGGCFPGGRDLWVYRRMALAKEFFLSLSNHWNIPVMRLQIMKVWVSSSGKQYSEYLRDLLSLSKCSQKYGNANDSSSLLQYLSLNLSNTKVLLGRSSKGLPNRAVLDGGAPRTKRTLLGGWCGHGDHAILRNRAV